MSTPTDPLALPSERDAALALAGQRELAAFLATGADVQRLALLDAHDRPHAIELPTAVLRLLADVLAELAAGNAVQVVPVHAELTTQQAADLLNVSRPYLVGLLERGAIAFRKTGRHRRVRYADLMAYRERQQREHEAAMAELVAQSQALGLGYE